MRIPLSPRMSEISVYYIPTDINILSVHVLGIGYHTLCRAVVRLSRHTFQHRFSYVLTLDLYYYRHPSLSITTNENVTDPEIRSILEGAAQKLSHLFKDTYRVPQLPFYLELHLELAPPTNGEGVAVCYTFVDHKLRLLYDLEPLAELLGDDPARECRFI